MMWRPQQMTEIEIEVPDRFTKKVTELLAADGFFHIEDVSFLNTDPNLTKEMDWQNKTIGFANLERQLLGTMQYLGIDEGSPPQKRVKMISDPDQLLPTTQQLEQQVLEATSTIEATQKEIEKLQSYLEMTRPFVNLDIPFDKIRNRRYLYSILGTIPSDKIDRFKTSMAKIPFALLELSQTGQKSVVLLLGTRHNKEYLRRAARSAYMTSIDLPDSYQGTPAEIVQKLEEQIAELQEKMRSTTLDVEQMRSSQANKLRDLYWHVHLSRKMAEAVTRYGKLRQSYLVVGWVPSDKLRDLEKQLQQISSEILVDIKEAADNGETHQPPVSLQNKGFLGGFQSLVTTYGLPGYNELDPTLLMSFTFPLLFGAMFGDVGQGILLALLGLLLMGRKIKKLRGLANLGSVVLFCGISAVVFGFLYGSVFGIEDLIPAIWQHPMDNIINIILLTFAGGALLLTLASIFSLINDARQHHWAHFIFSSKGLAGLILYWSLLAMVVNLLVPTLNLPGNIFIITTILSAIMIFFSGALERLFSHQKPLFEEKIFVYIIQAFFELFETLLGFLSNSLSYVRVGAFAVAHSGLSSVFFILANIVNPSKSFGYWAVVAFGNLFIIAFEGMIVSIQTLRLEYYEFFSRFFSGGGRKYAPLQLDRLKTRSK